MGFGQPGRLILSRRLSIRDTLGSIALGWSPPLGVLHRVIGTSRSSAVAGSPLGRRPDIDEVLVHERIGHQRRVPTERPQLGTAAVTRAGIPSPAGPVRPCLLPSARRRRVGPPSCWPCGLDPEHCPALHAVHEIWPPHYGSGRAASRRPLGSLPCSPLSPSRRMPPSGTEPAMSLSSSKTGLYGRAGPIRPRRRGESSDFTDRPGVAARVVRWSGTRIGRPAPAGFASEFAGTPPAIATATTPSRTDQGNCRTSRSILRQRVVDGPGRGER